MFHADLAYDELHLQGNLMETREEKNTVFIMDHNCEWDATQ